MNRILLVAHAPLADALRRCALHVFPDCSDALGCIDVSPDQPIEQTLTQARAGLAHLLGDTPDAGVLVLTDMLGATPSNIAQKLADDSTHAGVRLIAGVNLPMLLRALGYRHEPLNTLVQRACAGGISGVVEVSPANINMTEHA
ncbi:MAG: PTS fructose transporter subunit IIA [Burkholderiaceae bacterium]|jgi:PTS system ascorbate-specific IIA component|nr:PTS fructose transporter subunit IIA [Burkholderiaceae bacterium]